VNQADQLPGVSAAVFGQGQHFDGYGSKYSAVLPMLKKMASGDLVVLSDGRDVLINNPSFSGSETSQAALAEFRAAFEAITAQKPHAVVVSAEAQCCVSALTFAEPGDYFAADGSRAQRACSSGADDCLWNGDDKAKPWESFMQAIALERTEGKSYDDVYLNAGLMAGKVEDLIHVIEAAAIGNEEDDQAVLTDYMYQNQDAIVLDYGQTLFGNNRAGEEDSCMFELPTTGVRGQQRLVHTKTATTPLFVHSPGGLLKCHEELSDALGMQQVSHNARRRLLEWKARKMNYKDPCEDKTKPTTLTFEYTPFNDSVQNSQGGKSSVSGTVNQDTDVYIVSGEDEGSSEYFAGFVSTGSSITLDAMADKFKSNIYITIYASKGGAKLQVIEFHASCSVPIVIGDQFGALKLTGLTTGGGDGGKAQKEEKASKGDKDDKDDKGDKGDKVDKVDAPKEEKAPKSSAKDMSWW